MAASLAWPRRGEEGSGSQKWHLIEGVIGSRRVRHGHLGEDHTIPIRGVYLNLRTQPPIP